jgi:hypothetical protein
MFLPTCPLKLQTGNLALRNWVRFAHFTPRPGHAPHGNRLCPHTPVAPSLASFCTIASRQPPPAGPNWVRFARLASSWVGRPRPASSVAGRDWVRFAHFTPRPHRAPHACLCPNVPVPPRLALFCAFTLRPGRNWVRFARFDPRIGFVLHNHSPAGITARRPAPVFGRAGPIGFVSHDCSWGSVKFGV